MRSEQRWPPLLSDAAGSRSKRRGPYDALAAATAASASSCQQPTKRRHVYMEIERPQQSTLSQRMTHDRAFPESVSEELPPAEEYRGRLGSPEAGELRSQCHRRAFRRREDAGASDIDRRRDRGRRGPRHMPRRQAAPTSDSPVNIQEHFPPIATQGANRRFDTQIGHRRDRGSRGEIRRTADDGQRDISKEDGGIALPEVGHGKLAGEEIEHVDDEVMTRPIEDPREASPPADTGGDEDQDKEAAADDLEIGACSPGSKRPTALWASFDDPGRDGPLLLTPEDISEEPVDEMVAEDENVLLGESPSPVEEEHYSFCDTTGAETPEIIAAPVSPSAGADDKTDDTTIKDNQLVSFPTSMPLLSGCRGVHIYKKLNKISEGTYGAVYRAVSKETGEIVALKHIKYHEDVWEEGFPLTSLREIEILLELHHENIVNVREVVVGANPNQVFMVMEYVEHELKLVLERNHPPFSLAERKTLLYQLLAAVAFMHSNWVIHRDLKSSNLLYTNQGVLKVCDFGMARKFGDPIKQYTHNVVTLWYRAPELLLGQLAYTEAVDIWSVGCVMGELLLRAPLFPGTNDIDTLNQIFKLCGTPTDKTWNGFRELPRVEQQRLKFPHHPPTWRSVFPALRTHLTEAAALSEEGLDLLRSLLALDPKKRISAKAALKHSFFSEKPLPQRTHLMPSAPDSNVKARTRPDKSSTKSFFKDVSSRFGARVDAQQYLTELQTTAK